MDVAFVCTAWDVFNFIFKLARKQVCLHFVLDCNSVLFIFILCSCQSHLMVLYQKKETVLSIKVNAVKFNFKTVANLVGLSISGFIKSLKFV